MRDSVAAASMFSDIGECATWYVPRDASTRRRHGQRRRPARSDDYVIAPAATVPPSTPPKVKVEWRHRKDPSLVRVVAGDSPLPPSGRATVGAGSGGETDAGGRCAARGDAAGGRADRRHHRGDTTRSGPHGDDAGKAVTAPKAGGTRGKPAAGRTEWRHKKDPTLHGACASELYVTNANSGSRRHSAAVTRSTHAQSSRYDVDSNQNHSVVARRSEDPVTVPTRHDRPATSNRHLGPVRDAIERCLYGKYRYLITGSDVRAGDRKRPSQFRCVAYQKADTPRDCPQRTCMRTTSAFPCHRVKWPAHLQT